MTTPDAPTIPQTPAPEKRRRSVKPFAALAAASVLGAGAALGGAVALDAFDGGTTTVVEATPVASGSSPSAGSRQGGLSVNEIYERTAPGVVQITSTSRPQGDGQGDQFGFPFGGESPAQRALGSGFVIDEEGHIVTNYHVVEGATDIEVSFSNQDTMKAELVGSDPSTDLAVLKVEADASALTPLSLADSDEVEVGDPVVAIGNPFGLERTVTAGIVSALQRQVTAPNNFTIDHVIQTDAPINSGNSGGPLIDDRGRVIGVNSQIETANGSTGNVGIGFAVPSNTVKDVVGQLLADGRVDRAYLGVTLQDIDPDLANVLRISRDEGVLVQSVQPGSPAAKAGLKGGDTNVVVAGQSVEVGGDIVVAVDGKPVTSVDELREAIAAREPGDTVELDIVRGDEERTITVELGRQPGATR